MNSKIAFQGLIILGCFLASCDGLSEVDRSPTIDTADAQIPPSAIPITPIEPVPGELVEYIVHGVITKTTNK